LAVLSACSAPGREEICTAFPEAQMCAGTGFAARRHAAQGRREAAARRREPDRSLEERCKPRPRPLRPAGAALLLAEHATLRAGLLRRALADRPLRRESRTSRSARADIGQGLGQYRKRSMKRWGEVLCWVFFGVAILLLAAWPLMIWWHVNNGTPFVPATLETLPFPLGAIFFWIIARGLKLSTSLPPRY
jgi:hypothetical protein